MAAKLITDMEKFARDFEREEQARLAAEYEARRKKEEDLRRWAEAEERRRQEFERTQLGTAAGAAAGGSAWATG